MMEAVILSLSDLRVVSEEEPRLQDLRIAEALGFERPRAIRHLIQRNKTEIARFGLIATERGAYRGKEFDEYWLNEEQALLVSILSDAPRAAEVRHTLIKVFVEWRRGQLPPAPSSAAIIDPVVSAFSSMVDRLSAVETAIGFRDRMSDASLAASVAHMPIWKNGRRPNWWSDIELRTLLTSTHRQATIAHVHALAVQRFGPERVPSTKAIHRYWQLLDLVHGISPSKRVN